MKLISKKIICVGVLLIMGLGLFCGCSSKIVKQEGFSLEISVDKKIVKQGEELKVTAVLRNNTGLSHYIITSSTPIVLISVYSKRDNCKFERLANRIDSTIEKDAVIENSMKWEAQEKGRFYILVQAEFLIVEDYTEQTNWLPIINSSRELTIYSKKINIEVK